MLKVWLDPSWLLIVNARREKWMEDGIVKEKGTRFIDLDNSQPFCIRKSEKACSEKNSKGISNWPLDKKISKGCNMDFISHLDRGQMLSFKMRGKWPQRWQRSLGLFPLFQKGEPLPYFQQASWPLPKAMVGRAIQNLGVPTPVGQSFRSGWITPPVGPEGGTSALLGLKGRISVSIGLGHRELS